MVKTWLLAIRPKFFTGSVIPITLGAVVAWYQFGIFNWLVFMLTLAGGIFIHAGLDLANDYFDHKSGVDEINKKHSEFNGGSRFIQNGILKPAQVLAGSIICFVIGIAVGLYLNYILPGNTLLIIGLIGVFLAFFYTAGPFRIGYTGLGEFTVGLGFGPVMVLGSYFVQTGTITLLPVLASVPVGILIALVLFINEFPDYDADKQAKKRTLVVILGKKKSAVLYYLLLSIVYIFVLVCVILNIFPLITLIIFITIPLVIKAVKTISMNYEKFHELLPANAITIGLHLIIGVLLTVSYVIDGIFFT